MFNFVNIYGQNDERDIAFLSYQAKFTKYCEQGYYIPIEE